MGNAEEREKLKVKSEKLLWSIFFIIALWFVFGSPFFLRGKIPFAGDYQVTFFAPWSQYSQFSQPVVNNAMPDVIDQLYPWKHLVITDWKSGQIPLWNPYQFGGTPLMANYQSAVFSPLNVLFFLFPFKIGWALLVLLQPLLAGIGMYFFARKIAISKTGATFSSVAFMFCSFLVTWMGYGTLGYAVAALPFVLLGLEGYVQSKKFHYLFLTVLFLAFSFLSGHFQMSFYVLLAAFLYFLFRFLPSKSKKLILFSLLSLVFGVLLASIQIFPSIAFYAQSLRSTLFQRPEVIPWQYFITLLSPDFLGNPVTRNDWFGHYAEWGSYIGVLPLVFALFGVSEIKKNKYVFFFVILGVLSLLLATPNVVGDLILKLHIPVLSTSAAGRIIVLFSFSLAVLSGFGLDSWVKSSQKTKTILGGIGIVLLFLGWFVIIFKIGLTPEHAAIAKQNFLLPTAFLLYMIVATLFAYRFTNKKILLLLTFTFLLLTSFDMYRFASKWQSFSPSNLVFPDVGVTNFFKTIQDQRSLGNYGGQVSLYYQIPALEGYDALYPEKFGEFASFVANGTLQPASRSVVDFPKNGTYTKQAINLLGVQYIIQKVSDTNKPWAFSVQDYPAAEFKIVYQDNAYLVFQNQLANPHAFIWPFYKVVSEKDVLSTLFNSGDIVLEQDPKIPKINQFVVNDNNADITSYKADQVVIKTKTTVKSLLFLSDTYFPGWTASVDGKPAKIYRADYTFRAVVVPEGTHTVVFSYWPDSFTYGIAGSSVGLLLLTVIYFCQKRRVW